MKKVKNMMILSIAVLCLIILSACVKTTSSTITIKPDTGDITGALVTLRNNTGKKSHVYSQTAKGTAVDFNKVVLGSYTLTVEHEDYLPFTLSDLMINNTVSSHTANLYRKLIIIDKGSVSYGWRYLVAAPPHTEFTANRNTAVSRCKELSIDGLTGWALPDKDQLNLMYTNLHLNGLGDFKNEWYWSSTQYSNYRAWSQVFCSGGQDIYYKGEVYRVRAVRAF